MWKILTLKYLSLICLLYVSTVSCSASGPGSSKLPKWVMNTPPGCGMGSVQGVPSLSLAKTGATARGRDDLARQLQTRVESLMKTYRAEGGEDTKDLNEELLINISQQSSQALLQGTVAKEVFVGSDSPKTLYALVCYEPSQAPSFMKAFEQLPIKHRSSLREKAKASFEELEDLMKSYESL